jgi:uncharacterized protein (TIGR01244 family)
MPRTILFICLALILAMNSSTSTAQPADLSHIRAFREIDDRLATSGQIAYDDIAAIKAAGYEVVINLATADKDRNGEEGFRVVEQGMSYVHIPVSWEAPAQRDLALFFDILAQNRDRKVYVHCFANMRVSTFVYLYRTLKEGITEEEARADLLAIWDPASLDQWKAFVDNAKVNPPSSDQ